MTGFSSVLRNPEFLKLWVGQMISYIGDRITQMALLGWLIASGQSTGTEMSRITFFHMLPFFLFGQITGPFADRFSRKQVMIVCDLVRAVLVLWIAFLVVGATLVVAQSGRGQAPPLPHVVYFLVFLAGIGTAFFYPAKLAIIPQLVKPEALQAANALCTITGMVATLVGTYLAGVLIHRAGVTSGFIVDALTYVISAALIWWISVARHREAAEGSRGDLRLNVEIVRHKTSADPPKNWWRTSSQKTAPRNDNSAKAIWRYILQHRNARGLILISVVLSFLSSFFYIALTVLAVDFFKQGTEGLGKLLGMLGIGMMGGSLLSVWLRRFLRPRLLLAGSFLMISVMNFYLSIKVPGTTVPGTLSLGLFAIGAANAVIMITNDTLLQRISPNRLHGKIFGFRGFCTNGVFLLALLGVGELLKLGSPFLVFHLLAVIGLVVAFLIISHRQKIK